MINREDMLEDLEPTLEKRKIYLTAYQLDHLLDWVDVQIEFACKKQREICAATYFQNPEGLPSKTFEDIMTIIENAPSPLDEVK